MQRSLRLHIRRFCYHPTCRRYSVHAAIAKEPTESTVASSSRSVVTNLTRPSKAELNDTPNEEDPLTRRFSSRRLEKMRVDMVEEYEAGEAETDKNARMPNKVDVYLASLRAEGIEPTLEDLERCNPPNRPKSTSSNYVNAYQELVNRLSRTFSKAQLRNFCEMYGMEGKWTTKNRRKNEYAETIIEKQWGWESLKEIQRRHRDMTEVVTKTFMVSPHELFLLLGKDGSELLQISIDYNVHIAVEPNPLSVRIEGLRGALKKLESLITTRRKDIIGETILLPSAAPLSSSTLQQVSRLSNAFVENIGTRGKIQIYANGAKQVETAKKLAVRAAQDTLRIPAVPLLAFLPSKEADLKPVLFPPSYALYPFVPHSSGLGTRLAATKSYRCRRVNEWLGDRLGEDVVETGGLVGGRGKLLDVDGSPIQLRQLVSKAFPHATEPAVLNISTGHILFRYDNTTQGPSFLSALPGYWQLKKFLAWAKESAMHRYFMPSLPAPLFNNVPSGRTLLHRLSYRCLEPRDIQLDGNGYALSKVMTFEASLMDLASPTSSMIVKTVNEDVGGASEESETDLPEDDAKSFRHVDELGVGSDGETICRRGREVDFLISLPDRPMDIKLSVFSPCSTESKTSNSELQAYFSSFRDFLHNNKAAFPEPPLFIQDGEETYTLEINASVRRGVEIVDVSPPASAYASAEVAYSTVAVPHTVSTTTENILDLDTNQTVMNCELSCKDSSMPEAWEKFLEDCDALTSCTYQPIRSSEPSPFEAQAFKLASKS